MNVRGILDATLRVYQADPAYRLRPEVLGELHRIGARLNEPIRIALAGTLKSGKSTLVNALVGECIAPTDATEATRIVTWIRHGLDAGSMHAAAQRLVGHHDFSAFRSSECQSRTPLRDLTEIAVERHGDYVDIRVRANAFLHHMVRNIAGSLILVGRGERSSQWLADVLDGRDRRAAGPTAPPQGLYFAGAEYPAGIGLPSGKLQRPRSGAPQ
jgi:tRNA U38,U39,U40 pseudouridine synthase TruA